MTDCVVIGKGPAGLQAAIYIARAGLSVTVIGRDIGALDKAERIENYFGFEKPIGGHDLLATGTAQAKRLGVKIHTEEVLGAGWDEAGFRVKTSERELVTRSLVLATGMPRKKAAIKGIEAYEGAGVSYCAVCDAFFYKGKTVAVVGNGNYARQEARELLPFAGGITILTNGRPFEGDTDLSGIELDERAIRGIIGQEGRVAGVTFTDGSELRLDGIFVAEGTASALDLASKLGIVNNGRAIETDDQQMTNVPGIYAAGDCTGKLLQIAVAVGQGATAGMSVVNYLREQGGEKTQTVQWSK